MSGEVAGRVSCNSMKHLKFLVDHCARAAPIGQGARTFDHDVWIAQIVQNDRAKHGMGYEPPDPQHHAPFCDAAWQLSRIGVLRPGSLTPKGRDRVCATVFTGHGYSASEAISCHRNGNYLASCAMAGAAAESI